MATSLYESGVIDFSQPPKEVLFERFNAINGTDYSPDDFVLSEIEVVIGPNYDTLVRAMPVLTSQWSKGFPIYYSRVMLSEQMQHVAEVPTNGETNLYGILDTINAAYGIYLTEADVQDAIISYNDPQDPTGTGSVQIVARATSIFFIGTMVIPVNNTVSHGIATYDDELVHYLAVSEPGVTGKDVILCRDALGQTVQNFSFGQNLIWTSSTITHFFQKPDGSMIVTGNFTYQVPVSMPNPGTYTNKVLFLNSRGELISGTAGDLFGINYFGLKYVEAFEQDRIYAIDVQNSIGGNAHGLFAFKANGDFDSDFVPALTRRVDAVVAYKDWVYVSERNGDGCNIRRLNLDGSIDATFTSVPGNLPSGRPGIDFGRVVDLSASDRGLAALVMPNTITGVETWAEVSRELMNDGVSAPVIVISHEGIIEQAFSAPTHYMTTNRAGIAYAGCRVCLTTRAAVYLADTCDLASGLYHQCPAGVTEDGVISGMFSNSNEVEYPMFDSFQAVQLSTRGDVIVAARTSKYEGGIERMYATVVAYDIYGQFAARLLSVPDKMLIAYHHFRFM